MATMSPLPALLLVLLATLLSPARAYTALSDDSLRAIPRPGAALDVGDAAGLLAPLLVPRVPDTPGSARARRHFADFAAAALLPRWTLEWHNTTATTPATGDRRVGFRSLVLRRDPPWAAAGDVARLTLAAHYDSLYRPEGFVGAVDSAASCAMLLHLARAVDGALTRRWAAMAAAGDDDGLGGDKGVQILLLDGEEAWVSWTDTDSTYGSRALAEHWDATPHPASSVHKNDIDAISLFVLLDLLGAEDPRIPSYFPSTHWAYRHLAAIEERMRGLGLLESSPAHGRFLPEADKKPQHFRPGFISDDHVPFMERGVEVLHLIPTPFPWFWHKMEDDAEHLHGPTMQDWAKLITAFVAEWMDLEGYVTLPAGKGTTQHDEL